MKIANIKFHYKHAFDGKRFERWRDELIADRWTATDPTGEPDFTETTVELTNESIATKKESANLWKHWV